jgi:hypothetical protein
MIIDILKLNAIDGNLFITITNYGYFLYTLNMIKSLKIINFDKNLIIICLDKFSFEEFKNLGLNVIKYDYEIPQFNKYNEKDFALIRYIKLKVINEVINLGFNILYSDSDIFYHKNIKDDILEWSKSEYDVVIQNDTDKNENKKNLCTGFLYVKSNDKNIKFFELINDNIYSKIMNRIYRNYDQDFFNKEVRPNINVKVLSLKEYPNGKYWIKNKILQDSFKLIHFNWLIGMDKVTHMKNNNMWLITEEDKKLYKPKVFNIYNEYEKYDLQYVYGLGDYLRGCISLYKICKDMNYELILDYSNHSINNFLKNKYNITSNDYDDVKIKNFFLYHENDYDELKSIKKYINNHTCSFITTNLWQTSAISDECKKYIRDSLTPNQILKDEINRQMEILNIEEKKYICIHIRMGDSKLVNDKKDISKYNFVNEKIRKVLVSYKDYKIVVFSDDDDIKKYLNEKEGYLYLNTVSCHLGMKNNKLENVRDTLVDFFILSKCHKIVTYSQLSHGSGFSHWCSVLFDIEVIKS